MSSKIRESPSTEEDRKQYKRSSGLLGVSSLIFITVMATLVYTETVRLYPSNMKVDMVKGYAGRVEFALRYQTLLVAWLMFNIIATIAVRVTNKAVNPLDENSEQNVLPIKFVLNNSYEQIILSVFAQLIYVSFATPECILKTIPLVNILQFVGRIAYYYGYPMKRSFGFLTTVIPTFILIIFNMYSFILFIANRK